MKDGVTITGPQQPGDEAILTDAALAFVADLQRTFGARREALLARRPDLCLILIPRFGIVGAASANFAATCSWNLLLWLVARKKTGLDSSALGLPKHS